MDPSQLLSSLAIPRFPGTEGEKKVANTIIEELKRTGLENVVEEFAFTASHQLALKTWLFLKLALLSLSFFLIPQYLFASRILSLLLIGIIGSGSWLAKNLLLFPKEKGDFQGRSANIWTKVKSKNTLGKIFLVAHYDSKSSNLPLWIRSLLFLLGVIASLTLAFSLWLSWPLGVTLNTLFIQTIILVAIFSFLFLFLEKFGNRSPGALDNAGSVAVLLNLAEFWRKNPPINLDLVLLFTGAEELGLWGAKIFFQSHQDELNKDSLFINCEGMGVKGGWAIVSGVGLFPKKVWLIKFIREAAHHQGLRIFSLPILFGGLMDHVIFSLAGLKAVTLMPFSPKSLLIHTSQDRIELIKSEGLKEAQDLLVGIVRSLDEGRGWG